MGIALPIPNKTVVAVYNETWAVNIQSAIEPSAALLPDPIVTLFFREKTLYSDGTFSATNDPSRTTQDFVAQTSFYMSTIVMRNDVMTYRDRTGAEKSIPVYDVPLTVRYFLDLIGLEARQAKEAARLAEEARLAAEAAANNPEPPPEEPPPEE